MKTDRVMVAVVRHGKAETESPTGLDADRPLRRRGELQAAWVGRWLAENGFGSGLVCASPAVRTRSTAERIASAIGGASVGFDDRLFIDQPASGAVELISERLAEGVGRLVLVGHNPQVSRLAGLGAGRVAGSMGLRTGTCAVVQVPPGAVFGGGSTLEGVVRMDEPGGG